MNFKTKIKLGICGLAALLGSAVAGCGSGLAGDGILYNQGDIPSSPSYCVGTLGCEPVNFDELTVDEVIEKIKCPNDFSYYQKSHLSCDNPPGETLEAIHESGKGVCRHHAFFAAASLYDNGFPVEYLLMNYVDEAWTGTIANHAVYLFKSNEGLYGTLGLNYGDNWYGFFSLEDVCWFHEVLHETENKEFFLIKSHPAPIIPNASLKLNPIVFDFSKPIPTETEREQILNEYFERLTPYKTCPKIK